MPSTAYAHRKPDHRKITNKSDPENGQRGPVDRMLLATVCAAFQSLRRRTECQRVSPQDSRSEPRADLTITGSGAAQKGNGSQQWNPDIPRTWDDAALADWATPVAGLNVRPTHMTAKEYYALLTQNVRTYRCMCPTASRAATGKCCSVSDRSR